MRFYIVLLICSIVTFSSRFAPFLIFKDGKVNETIRYLGDKLPYALMALLVVYSLKDSLLDISISGIWQLAAALICVITYVYKRNVIISMFLSTAFYMLMIRLF